MLSVSHANLGHTQTAELITDIRGYDLNRPKGNTVAATKIKADIHRLSSLFGLHQTQRSLAICLTLNSATQDALAL